MRAAKRACTAALLLAKDLAQHAHRVPGAAEASEDVVAILALVERNLRGA